MTNLSTSNWPDLGPVDVVLVPLGSTEQHGPHLPFETDTVIAGAVAQGLSARLRERGVASVVAPAIPVGSSGEHQSFAGTISIGNEALRHVVIELARSLKTWTPRLVFVNGHGGNVPALNDAIGQLVLEGHDVLWLACGVPGHDAHAGREETSIMLHLAPEYVRLDRAEPGITENLASLLPQLRAGGVASVSPNGVLGDPTGATSQQGQELLDQMVSTQFLKIATQWPGLFEAR